MSELPPMSPRDERLYDLLIARSTSGLSQAEERELGELLASVDPIEVAAIENAVDALARGLDAEDLVGLDEEPMPESLRSSLLATVPDASSSPATDRTAASVARPAMDSERASERASASSAGPDPRDAVIAQLRWTSRTGWVAAAASLVIAAGLLLSRGGLGGGGQPVQPPQPSIRQRVDAAADVIHLAMAATPDGPSGASGEVVWSDSLQQGYMRLTGVPANDAAKRQYQLWIVDPKRAKEPVDGGVFDVAATGEVVIPFESRLAVAKPAAFAITAEQPGGVVVSAGPLLLVAAAPST